MDFAYGTSFLRSSPDAYERLLLDCLLGDATLFIRWDEVERAWEIMDPLVERWKHDDKDLALYEAGMWGPVEADELMAREGRAWRRL
jgi:glucose-6-phosphate 1-dehydrogenase